MTAVEAPAIIQQRWEDLLFVHSRVRPEDVTPLLPAGLQLDTFEGRAYVGVIPFTVPENHPRLVPSLLSLPFHEINVRTYVKGPGGVPGVWFFSLDASSRLVVESARLFYSLPYRFADIQFARRENALPDHRTWISFESRRVSDTPPDFTARYSPAGLPRPASPGTLEHFLIERYVLFAWTGQRLLSGRVHHEPYPVQEVEVEGLQERLVEAAGLPPVHGERLVHYAKGVAVDIEWPVSAEHAGAVSDSRR
jgi:uncharacterized protein